MTATERKELIDHMKRVSQNRLEFRGNYQGTNSTTDKMRILQLSNDVNTLANVLMVMLQEK